jgi:acetoacetyl-CoA synthetase
MSTPVEPLKSSPFVTIKDGLEKPPIFIIHGVCGRVQFSKLAGQIQTHNPVYGIQARGTDGIEPPFDRIEDMSSFYLEALTHFYPHGAYILIGYSFGGLIALEMAQQLIENGRCVPLLFLVDAYPHPRFLEPNQRKRLFLRRMGRHFEKMRQLSLPAAFFYFIKGFKNRLRVFSTRSKTLAKPYHERDSALKLVETKAYDALAVYKPKFYPGKINFVAPDEKSFFPERPEPVWANLANELEVDFIPGNHLNIVTSQSQALAAVVTRHIRTLECRGYSPLSQPQTDQYAPVSRIPANLVEKHELNRS